MLLIHWWSLQGSVVDLLAAARALVRDWKNGKFVYYTMPPKSLTSDTTSQKASTDMWTTKDEKVLGVILPRRDFRRARSGLVLLKAGEIDKRTVDLEATVDLLEDDDADTADHEDEDMNAWGGFGTGGDEDQIDEDSQSGLDSGDEDSVSGSSDNSGDANHDEIDELDESSEIEEMEPEPVSIPKKLSGKRKRQQLPSSTQEPVKKLRKQVSFAAHTKAGAKLPRKKDAPSAAGSKKNGLQGKISGVQDGETYDFSRYF